MTTRARPRMEPRIAARRRGVAAARGRSHRTAVLAGVSGLAALAATWWLLTGPAVAIRTVVVKGYDRPDVAALDAYVQRAVARGSMLDLPLEELRTELARFPWVADVLIERDWPATVHVDIVQTRPALAVRRPSGPIGVVSGDGRLLGKASPVETKTLPRLRVRTLPTAIGEPLRLAEERAVARFVGLLPDMPGFRVRTIEINSAGGIVARLASGLEVRLGPAELMREKALAVASVVPLLPVEDRKEGTYLDVRVPRNPAVGKESLGGPAGGPAPGAAGVGQATTPPPTTPAEPAATPTPATSTPPGSSPAASAPTSVPTTGQPTATHPTQPPGQPSSPTQDSDPPPPPGGSNAGPGVDSVAPTG